MNILAFEARRQSDGTWQSCELKELQTTFAAELASGKASGWDVAATEVGDPQFYLLGPSPAEPCILSISRIGRLYILEDGAGHVLFENVRLESLTAQAKSYLKKTKAGIVAAVIAAWETTRQRFHENVESLLAESEELLMHIAPQIGVFV